MNKDPGIPWYLFPGITGLAIATFAMGQMPGSLQMQNIIPTQILGTSLTAAPVEGVLATLFMLVFGVGYLYWQAAKGKNDPEASIELYNRIPPIIITNIPVKIKIF